MKFIAESDTPFVIPIGGFLTENRKISPITIGVVPSGSVQIMIQITNGGNWYPITDGLLKGYIAEPTADALIAPVTALKFLPSDGDCIVEVMQ